MSIISFDIETSRTAKRDVSLTTLAHFLNGLGMLNVGMMFSLGYGKEFVDPLDKAFSKRLGRNYLRLYRQLTYGKPTHRSEIDSALSAELVSVFSEEIMRLGIPSPGLVILTTGSIRGRIRERYEEVAQGVSKFFSKSSVSVNKRSGGETWASRALDKLPRDVHPLVDVLISGGVGEISLAFAEAHVTRVKTSVMDDERPAKRSARTRARMKMTSEDKGLAE